LFLSFTLVSNALVMDTFGNIIPDNILIVDTSSNIETRQLPKEFKEKYQGNDFDYDITIDQTLSLGDRFERWLVQILVRLFDSTPEGTGKVVGLAFKIVGSLLILFVLFKILMHFINKDGSFIFGRSSDSLIIEATNIDQNINSTNFKTLINKALEKNNYRLAIRYHYLQVLKHLSKKGEIEWDTEKTNYDYYREIKDEKTREEFQYISYIYDYCWYGEFEISNEDYNKGALAFNKLLEKK